MNLSVHYNVSTAQVTWGAARGASSYSAKAVAEQGFTVRCDTTNNSCFLTGLQCGQIYNVSVTAHTWACDSETSLTSRIATGWWSDGKESDDQVFTANVRLI